jgi:hypothetical protein
MVAVMDHGARDGEERFRAYSGRGDWACRPGAAIAGLLPRAQPGVIKASRIGGVLRLLAPGFREGLFIGPRVNKPGQHEALGQASGVALCDDAEAASAGPAPQRRHRDDDASCEGSGESDGEPLSERRSSRRGVRAGSPVRRNLARSNREDVVRGRPSRPGIGAEEGQTRASTTPIDHAAVSLPTAVVGSR